MPKHSKLLRLSFVGSSQALPFGVPFAGNRFAVPSFGVPTLLTSVVGAQTQGQQFQRADPVKSAETSEEIPMNDPFVERIQKGLKVWSSDGRRLGEVVAVRADSFDVQKGFFFPKNYIMPFDDVRDVLGDKVILTRTRKQLGLRDGFWDMFVGLAGPEDLAHGRRNELTRRDTQPKEEERIPVYGVREELKGSNAVEVFDIEKQPIVREEARVTKTPGEESPATTTVQPEDVREQKQDPSFESREVSKTIMK